MNKNYRSYKNLKKWGNRTKKRMIESLGGRCVICGLKSDHYEIYDFHHLDPSKKERNLSGIRTRPLAWKKVVKELRKCVLLCSNCHRLHHAGIEGYEIPTNVRRFDESFVSYLSYIEGLYTEIDKCTICGKFKDKNKIYCSNPCARKGNSKIFLTKEQLLDMMKKSSSWLEMARNMGVSDNALRKCAKKFEIKWERYTCKPIEI